MSIATYLYQGPAGMSQDVSNGMPSLLATVLAKQGLLLPLQFAKLNDQRKRAIDAVNAINLDKDKSQAMVVKKVREDRQRLKEVDQELKVRAHCSLKCMHASPPCICYCRHIMWPS